MNRKYQVENVCENVYRIEEFGLGTIYLVKGRDSAVLIDTGTGVADLKGLVESMVDTPYDVILTHGHYDHAGGIGQFDSVYVNKKDIELIKSITLEERVSYAEAILATYPVDEPLFELNDIKQWEKLPKFKCVDDKTTLDLGDKTLEIFEVPGHTKGSICILDRADRVLFSGDNLQPILLLTMDGEDRENVIKEWYEASKKVCCHIDDFDYLCGGHEKIEKNIIPELQECGRLIVEGNLKPESTQIHIFDGLFVKYKSIHITYQTLEELMN